MDGYRVRIDRDGDRVRLFSRNGYDSTARFPWIINGRHPPPEVSGGLSH
ncbi:hypothetical protein ACRQ5Q_38930 [Bradyrhizobium sp. PMVTL-01]